MSIRVLVTTIIGQCKVNTEDTELATHCLLKAVNIGGGGGGGGEGGQSVNALIIHGLSVYGPWKGTLASYSFMVHGSA